MRDLATDGNASVVGRQAGSPAKVADGIDLGGGWWYLPGG